MNLIYVGSSMPEELVHEYQQKGSTVNFAGMTLQNALLDGLYFHNNNLNIISARSISPYPKVKQIVFSKEYLEFKGRRDRYKFVSILNLPAINMLSNFAKVRCELKRQLKASKEENAVIVYETHTPFLLAAATLRKQIDKLVVIVPDLPEFMHGHSNPIKRVLKKVDYYLRNWCLKRYDGYILLSEHMRERLPKKERFLVMEGIFNPEFRDTYEEKEVNRTIMYTGGVYKHRGTDLLLEAFKGIENPNYRLWIRGDGDLKPQILAMAEEDERIKYFPPMNREELLKLERRATVMVNTTQPQDFTKYFFPSKNMEYLASGTPTVMFRLGCMPPEYNKYLYYVESDDVEALRKKLIEVCEKPQQELNEFGEKAKNFILTRKNPQVQCGRIIDFVKKL